MTVPTTVPAAEFSAIVPPVKANAIGASLTFVKPIENTLS